MGKSARLLGKDFYLNGQEMNQLLKDQGFLEGEPGAYRVTEKGMPFATETDLHRGTGGSPMYNKHWSERTWDPSIMNELDMSLKKQQAAIDAVANRRAAAAAARKAAAEVAERNYMATGSAFISPVGDTDDSPVNSGSGITVGDVAIGVGIAGGLFGICYGIYKVAPHVKQWWDEKAKPWLFGE